MMRGVAPCKRGHRVDWEARTGTIYGTTHNIGTELQVKWDDRKTIDHWPAKALEKIDESSTEFRPRGGRAWRLRTD